MVPPPPPPPWLWSSSLFLRPEPTPAPNPKPTLATGTSVTPSRSTGSPKTADTDALAPSLSARRSSSSAIGRARLAASRASSVVIVCPSVAGRAHYRPGRCEKAADDRTGVAVAGALAWVQTQAPEDGPTRPVQAQPASTGGA